MNAWVDPWGLDTFYQLFNGETLVYEGISQLNKRRNDGGFYHSYDPNNVKDGRTFISRDDIELKMSQGKTAEVDSKGHIINNTH